MCKGRTKHLLTRLRQSPQLLKLYDIIVDQECRERVNGIPLLSTLEPSVHYLSHQQGPSNNSHLHWSCYDNSFAAGLNDCLEVGLPFSNDLYLNFRLHNYAY